MHALCKRFKEGYAWEYLWMNWYRFDKWKLWARAVTLDYYPIIQTNAPVETHWNHLKNRILHYLTHPRLDRLCFEIHNMLIPISILKIRQLRKGIKASSWHHSMITEWRKLEEEITEQDAKDWAEAQEKSIDLAAENSPAMERRRWMGKDHHTDPKNWSCQCAGFNYSPYHICSHLLRLYDQPYPLRNESMRQHRPPLLFIEDYHDSAQKVADIPSAIEHEEDPSASLEELGLSQQDLEDFTKEFGDVNDYADPSRHEEEVRKYMAWIQTYVRACNYAMEEMKHNRERFCRLSKTTSQGMISLVKLAANAHILDNSR